MIISCGIYIHINDTLCICHPTNASIKSWSIPKGQLELGESIIDRALIETLEETNINLFEYKKDLVYLGSKKYPKRKKILEAFYINANNINITKDIRCTSYTEGGFLENDIVKFEKIEIIKEYKLLHETQMYFLENILKL